MNGLFSARINTALIYTLAFFFCLTIVSYYLATNGKINNFPNYFSLIFLVVYGVVNFNRKIPATIPNVSGPLVFLFIFLFYMSLTTLWSSDASLSVFRLYVGYSILIISFILSYLICHEKLSLFRDWMLPILVLCASVSACYSIYFFYGIENYHPLDEDRLYALGRLRNPVIGAISYGIAAVLAGFFVRFKSGLIEKTLWMFCLISLLVAILLTGTRGVWVGLAAVVVVYVVDLSSLKLSSKLLILTLCLLLIGASLTAIYFMGGENFINHRSLSFRPEIWIASIQKVYDYNLILGLGINTNSELTHGHLTFQHSHSIYLSTLFYGGILGLIFLASLIVVSLKYLYQIEKSHERDLALAAFIFGLTVFAIDGDRLLEKIDFHWIAFWLPLTLVIALRNSPPKNSEGF